MKNIYKRIFAINLVTISFLCMEITNVVAQNCAILPTCESLGFNLSETDCEGRNILKCPFDASKIFCIRTIEEKANCDAPKVGDILYFDMSCSTEIIKNIPIGVIFDSERRLAIALEESRAKWSNDDFDIPELANINDESIATADFNGKSNTQTIVNYCKSIYTSCPAAEFAYNYSTRGTKAGDWYLPAAGELQSIYDKKAKLNETLQALGKTELTNFHYWSSTEENRLSVWVSSIFHGDMDHAIAKSNTFSVRPVLAF